MAIVSRSLLSRVPFLLLLTATAVAAPESEKPALSEHCICLSEGGAPELGWVAFKFTEKAAVGGAFSDISVHYRHDAHTLEDFLASGEFAASVNSVATGNPVRDETLRKSFFSLFTTDKLRGNVVKVEEDTFVVNIEMNGQKKPVSFKYRISDEGVLSASSMLDMLDFGLKEAHESIHKACEKLHTGTDGVSKTWTEVALNIKATIRKDCACS